MSELRLGLPDVCLEAGFAHIPNNWVIFFYNDFLLKIIFLHILKGKANE